MSRILYVTNGFPYPLTSGYLRHHHLIAALAERGHAVTLLAVAGPDTSEADVAAMEPVVESVVAMRRRPVRGRKRLERRLRTILGLPDPLAARLVAEARRRHAERPFDVLVLSGKSTAPVAFELRDLPTVVDLCDAVTLRLRSQRAVAPLAKRPLLALAEARMRRLEHRLVRTADALVYASLRDREEIAPERAPGGAGGAAPASLVVPNGVDLAYWRRTRPGLGDRIVLTGAMHYGPNADAAIHLARRILPLVRERRPDARVTIVGRDPSAAVRALAALPGVEVTGGVPDVRPYLEAAAVFAAPIRFGAGIQNKVLEALAMEVPVVASSLAADGLRLGDGRLAPVVVADDPAAFATALVARLEAAVADPAPFAEGRRHVADAFSWPAAADTLERAIASALGRPRAAAVATPLPAGGPR